MLGRTIEEAVKRGRPMTSKGYLYSYDMLGEAARTEADALRYHHAYADAISSLNSGATGTDIRRNPGISVKLSAIHPRYEIAQKETMLPVMSERLLALALAARHARMGLNIDAEEADRLDLSLDVIERVLAEPELAGWNGFGVVVQAYGPRAAFVIDWLYALAQRLDRQIMVRLVKGAYWDTEIKRAQTLGLAGYPVFTRKANTDVSYIANARKLLSMTDRIYPQFATHNAHTVAAILEMADRTATASSSSACTAWARRCTRPCARPKARAAASMRRSARIPTCSPIWFAGCSRTAPIPPSSTRSPTSTCRPRRSRAIRSTTGRDPRPGRQSGDRRRRPRSSAACAQQFAGLGHHRSAGAGRDRAGARRRFAGPDRWTASADHARGRRRPAAGRSSIRPSPDDRVGTVREASAEQVADGGRIAVAAQPGWANVAGRASARRCCTAPADLYEANAVEFFALATREAGKTLADGIAEVREAVDFLRYYAAEADARRGRHRAARRHRLHLAVEFSAGDLHRPDRGRAGHRQYGARQAGRADAADRRARRGAAAARPASRRMCCSCLPGDGPSVGAPLTADPRIAGVCFTGSTEVARLIERQLAETAAPDAMLIAETGGLNAMIVDSTALPEQAVRDILAVGLPECRPALLGAAPALRPEGRREEDRRDARRAPWQELNVGDPWSIATDVGPVIDDEARAGDLATMPPRWKAKGRLIAKVERRAAGRFVAPQVFRVSGIGEMEREIFGPVLHVATFDADKLDTRHCPTSTARATA